MFTGIILGQGKVVGKRSSGSGMIFSLESGFDLNDPEEGESIAVNGVCLTARNISLRKFTVDVSPESLARTNLGKLSVGSKVNLERALRLSDRLGGLWSAVTWMQYPRFLKGSHSAIFSGSLSGCLPD